MRDLLSQSWTKSGAQSYPSGPGSAEPNWRVESRVQVAVAKTQDGGPLMEEQSLDVRSAALAFTEGVREGWTLHDLVVWADRYMIRAGRLRTSEPYPRLKMREASVGVISYGHPRLHEETSGFLPHSEVSRLLWVSRQNVVRGLRGLLQAPRDDRFVQAAIYAGRVVRKTLADRSRTWTVMLDEDCSLSEQVLALFACDLLRNSQEYETGLVVCEACEAVTFWPERLNPTGCPLHPDGLIHIPTAPPLLQRIKL